MEQSIIRASGSRKESIAQVRLKPGTGKIEINGREPLNYLCRQNLITMAFAPVEEAKLTGRLDMIIKTSGGGLSGQAGAMRLAVSRALIKFNPELRGALKDAGFLTRDSRMVERKKYGQAKARKRFQFSKR